MNTESHSSRQTPTFSELLDYAEGRLAGADHQRVAAFIAEHPQAVATEWAWVKDFLNKARSLQLHPLPADLEERLNRLHPAGPAESPREQVSGWMESIRRVVAELVDTVAVPDFAAAGLRSKAFDHPAPQWVFKTAQFDIWVNALERPDQRHDLHGQVFPTAGDGVIKAGSAQLLRDDRECGMAAVDAYGEFVIQGVPAGTYALVIAGEDSEVVCSPVTFGA
jgi:hypothetical protein